MPKIKYQDFNFNPKTLALIEQSNAIIAEYQADDLQLTLRQLFYQLVSRDLIPNKVTEYKRLGSIVNDGRLAGLIDWDAIEDRTRNLESVSHWTTPADIIESAASSFRIDKWGDQSYRLEIWIEKEALAGVFDRICRTLDVPYFACRGYTSQSEMWSGAMRFVRYLNAGKRVRIYHFGDHDPSGIDMTRDIEDRLRMFCAHHVGEARAKRLSIVRVALNMDQVEQYHPPENPAKATDSRFRGYQEQFGDSSWELDALNPRVLAALVRDHVTGVRDEEKWQAQVERENRDRALLVVTSEHWPELEKHTDENWGEEVAGKIEEQNEQNGEAAEAEPESDGEPKDGEETEE